MLNTVTISLEEYNLLKEFHNEIRKGAEIIDMYQYYNTHTLSCINRYFYLTKDDFAKKYQNEQTELYNKLYHKDKEIERLKSRSLWQRIINK